MNEWHCGLHVVGRSAVTDSQPATLRRETVLNGIKTNYYQLRYGLSSPLLLLIIFCHHPSILPANESDTETVTNEDYRRKNSEICNAWQRARCGWKQRLNETLVRLARPANRPSS